MIRGKKQAALGVALLTTAGLFASLGASASGAAEAAAGEATATHATLRPLNNAPAKGTADVSVDGRRIDVSLDANRLLKGMPHAQHIHFGAQARHECPTVRDDDNADHRLSTAEGIPAYGPVRVSLTKRGDTSPTARSRSSATRWPRTARSTTTGTVSGSRARWPVPSATATPSW